MPALTTTATMTDSELVFVGPQVTETVGSTATETISETAGVTESAAALLAAELTPVATLEMTATAEMTATSELTVIAEPTPAAAITETDTLTATELVTVSTATTATTATTRRPTLTEISGAALTLPNVGEGEGITLNDGMYSSAITGTAAVTDAVTEAITEGAELAGAVVAPVRVQLLPLLATGDLNDDGMDDATAIASVSGGAAQRPLFAGLHRASRGHAGAGGCGADWLGSGCLWLGNHRFPESDGQSTGGQIIVELEQMATADATCCATAAERRTYALRDGRLVLVDAQPIELPYLPRADAAAAKRFPMARNAMTGTVEAELEAGTVASYRLESGVAQTATVTLEVADGAAALAVSQQGMPAALLAARTGAVTWSGALPSEGALLLDVVSLQAEGDATPYALTVSLEAAESK